MMLNFLLGMCTLFVPLFIYRGFLWLVDSRRKSVTVAPEPVADTELTLAAS